MLSRGCAFSTDAGLPLDGKPECEHVRWRNMNLCDRRAKRTHGKAHPCVLLLAQAHATAVSAGGAQQLALAASLLNLHIESDENPNPMPQWRP